MLADTYTEDTRVIDSCGNVFIDLGFPPHEAEILQLRADMMGRLHLWVQDNGLTQAEAAERLGVTQARIVCHRSTPTMDTAFPEQQDRGDCRFG